MKFELTCPGCGAVMLTVEWDDRSPYVRRLKREARAAEARQGRGIRSGRNRDRRASVMRLKERVDAVVAEVITQDQAKRLKQHPETYYHACGAAVLLTGDPSEPFGRRVVTLRGRGAGRSDEPAERGGAHGRAPVSLRGGANP